MLEYTTSLMHLVSIELGLSLVLNTLSFLFFLLVIIIGLATNLYTLN